MTLQEAMAELARGGDEQGRRTLARHGVPPPAYGVRYADLNRLRTEIGHDTELARALWITGNHDARVLATLIAHPNEISRAELDAWVSEAQYRILNDAVAGLAVKSPHARLLADAWRRDLSEWTSAAGWHVVGGTAAKGAEEAWLSPCLDEIRRMIHLAPNYTRHSMNNALIAIGGCCPALTARALDVAAAIGKVEVDHGDTKCTTPDATGYIRKMLEHEAKKRAPAAPAEPAPPKRAPAPATKPGKRKGAAMRKPARKASAARRASPRPPARKKAAARKKTPRRRKR